MSNLLKPWAPTHFGDAGFRNRGEEYVSILFTHDINIQATLLGGLMLVGLLDMVKLSFVSIIYVFFL